MGSDRAPARSQEYVELGRAAWAGGEDLFWFHDQDGVEFQAFRLRCHSRARHTRWPDHDAGAFATGLVPYEFLDGSGQFVFGDPPGPWLDAARADPDSLVKITKSRALSVLP